MLSEWPSAATAGAYSSVYSVVTTAFPFSGDSESDRKEALVRG